jgi:Tfp pilus assembly protein PilE
MSGVTTATSGGSKVDNVGPGPDPFIQTNQNPKKKEETDTLESQSTEGRSCITALYEGIVSFLKLVFCFCCSKSDESASKAQITQLEAFYEQHFADNTKEVNDEIFRFRFAELPNGVQTEFFKILASQMSSGHRSVSHKTAQDVFQGKKIINNRNLTHLCRNGEVKTALRQLIGLQKVK